jgi:minor extracellular serine protease Vpr
LLCNSRTLTSYNIRKMILYGKAMNQKIENLLNVSLSATRKELENSESLSTGFNWRDDTWEIIVKYSGTLENIRKKYNVYIRELLYNYAIIVTDKNTIELISQETNIDYIEKPKSIYFQLERAKSAACANNVRAGNKNIVNKNVISNAYNGTYLSGKGVIVAVIDTGIDILSDEFRKSDGSTRILNIYDQTQQTKYSEEDINAYLNKAIVNKDNTYNGKSIQIPGADNTQHGTNVAIIACGRSGVAYGADIIAVKMGYSYNNQFPRTTSLMDAIDYVIRKAVEYEKPVAINISYGFNYGDHDGNTLLERYINDVASGYKCSICIGSGNEADKAVHYGNIIKQGQIDTVEISVSEYEHSIDIQIWKYYWDVYRIMLAGPDGTQFNITGQGYINRFRILDTDIISLLGEPSPYNLYQEIYINLQPSKDYITPGIWKIIIYGESIRQGVYNIWLPSSQSLNIATGFVKPVPYDTITIPATATGCISVGAYNSYTGAYASFSGRGKGIWNKDIRYTYNNGDNNAAVNYIDAGIKPDILAPGVDIKIRRQTAYETDIVSVTGTSYAVPFVTGGAALLMQWGIVMGNDRYMYGEKLKAYLRRGARPLGIEMHAAAPNPVTGYGRLCIADSIPV